MQVDSRKIAYSVIRGNLGHGKGKWTLREEKYGKPTRIEIHKKNYLKIKMVGNIFNYPWHNSSIIPWLRHYIS